MSDFTIPNLADAQAVGFEGLSKPDSTDIAAISAAIRGYGVLTGCVVTAQATPNNTVAVSAGTVTTPTATATVTGGNVTMAAAHASLPRRDIVLASLSTGALSWSAGTAAADSSTSAPVKPSYDPATHALLAEVYVPANDTAISSTQIKSKRLPLVVGAHSHASGSTAGQVPHSNLTSVTPDCHHNQAHALEGADHSVTGRAVGDVLMATGPTAMGYGNVLVARFSSPGLLYPPALAGPLGTNALDLHDEIAIPFPVGTTGTFTGIYAEVHTTAAGAGNVLRFGLRSDNGTNYPGTLIEDLGTIASDTVGMKTKPFATARTLTPGLYWVTVCPQGTGVAGTLRSQTHAIIVVPQASTTAMQATCGWTQSGITGALPAAWSATRTPTLKGPLLKMAVQ